MSWLHQANREIVQSLKKALPKELLMSVFLWRRVRRHGSNCFNLDYALKNLLRI